ARALQPCVITQSAEGLLVEDKRGGPALQVHARSDTSGTLHKHICCSSADPYGNHTGGLWELQAHLVQSPFDLQPGEPEPAQLGGDLRRSTLDRELPGDSGAQRDLRRTPFPGEPEFSRIADSDHSLFRCHLWHRSLKAGLVEHAL